MTAPSSLPRSCRRHHTWISSTVVASG
jgi:hypothetical protein